MAGGMRSAPRAPPARSQRSPKRRRPSTAPPEGAARFRRDGGWTSLHLLRDLPVGPMKTGYTPGPSSCASESSGAGARSSPGARRCSDRSDSTLVTFATTPLAPIRARRSRLAASHWLEAESSPTMNIGPESPPGVRMRRGALSRPGRIDVVCTGNATGSACCAIEGSATGGWAGDSLATNGSMYGRWGPSVRLRGSSRGRQWLTLPGTAAIAPQAATALYLKAAHTWPSLPSRSKTWPAYRAALRVSDGEW